MVFAKDPQLGKDVPFTIRRHWENIDNCGTHGDVFAREIMVDALVAGHAAILVDFPATGGTQSAPDEAGAIRPYWVPIQKENILSWRTTLEEGRSVLTQVVLKESTVVPDGLYGEKKIDRFRIFNRNKRIVEDGSELLSITFRLVEIEGDALTEVASGVYTNQDEIPIAEVPTSGRLGIFESTPPLADIAHLNVSHYQQSSDHSYALFMSAVPILVRIGATAGEGTEAIVGANAAMDLPKDADLKYVTPPAAALDAAKENMETVVSTIGSLGLAMLAPQKRAAETAEAKRLDKAGSDSALAATARALQDALERALGFHAKYLRLPGGGSITINRDFGMSLMEPAVLNGIASLVREGFPHRVALQMMQLGGRIPEDLDLDLLEAEWIGSQEASREIANVNSNNPPNLGAA
jgi:hypothetical protein